MLVLIESGKNRDSLFSILVIAFGKVIGATAVVTGVEEGGKRKIGWSSCGSLLPCCSFPPSEIRTSFLMLLRVGVNVVDVCWEVNKASSSR